MVADQPDSAITMLLNAIHCAPVQPAAATIRCPSALFCAAVPETPPPVDVTVPVDDPPELRRLTGFSSPPSGLNRPLDDTPVVCVCLAGDFPAIRSRNVVETE